MMGFGARAHVACILLRATGDGVGVSGVRAYWRPDGVGGLEMQACHLKEPPLSHGWTAQIKRGGLGDR